MNTEMGQVIIACGLCGAPTTMTGTKRCDRCWELETRIHGDVALAQKILDARRTQDRRHADRRVSPAVGEYAIQECARLRESNKELLHALEMVRDANRDDPHIPQAALDCINAALAKAQP